MTKRILIVNADDCNLTAQVTESILQAHKTGIVTSTTFLVNLPIDKKVVRKILSCKKLGLGLHLNITLGKPLANPKKIPSLLQKEGRFKKKDHYFLGALPPVSEITEEFSAQLKKFTQVFKRLPTHIDVHHHMHDFGPFFKALVPLAKKYNLPIRWTRILKLSEFKGISAGICSTQNFYGNLDPRTFWSEEVLRHLLFTLPFGTSEIMCHPGWVDEELSSISSLTEPREREYQLFSRKELRHYLTSLGIELVNFEALK